jgi:hypothetical protein
LIVSIDWRQLKYTFQYLLACMLVVFRVPVNHSLIQFWIYQDINELIIRKKQTNNSNGQSNGAKGYLTHKVIGNLVQCLSLVKKDLYCLDYSCILEMVLVSLLVKTLVKTFVYCEHLHVHHMVHGNVSCSCLG